MDYDTIQNDLFSLQIPKDWKLKADVPSEKTYFESVDGTKGLYLLLMRHPQDDPKTVAEHLNLVKRGSVRSLHAMEGHQWHTLRDSIHADQQDGALILDSLEREKTYRIVEKALFKKPFFGMLSLHDYWCENLQQSDKVLLPIINSFTLK